MPNGSAPGGSGISYAELKCMSDDTLNLLSDLCNVSVAAGLPPTEWCKEIVYMIPKSDVATSCSWRRQRADSRLAAGAAGFLKRRYIYITQPRIYVD